LDYVRGMFVPLGEEWHGGRTRQVEWLSGHSRHPDSHPTQILMLPEQPEALVGPGDVGDTDEALDLAASESRKLIVEQLRDSPEGMPPLAVEAIGVMGSRPDDVAHLSSHAGTRSV
jgi:hypothetical protein